MHRYLLFFNYRGTAFRGSQKILNREATKDWKEVDLLQKEKSIQGYIETALKFAVKPKNDPIFFLSSRTDAGVHAYCNSGTVDLQHQTENRFFDPHWLTNKLNLYFLKKNIDIRVGKSVAVHPDFRARKDVSSRSYLYQIVTTSLPQRVMINFNEDKRNRPRNYLKTQEFLKCWLPVFLSDHYMQVSREKFCLDQLRESMELFKGEHNFRAFTSTQGWVRYSKDPGGGGYLPMMRSEEEFIRKIDIIDAYEVPSPCPRDPFFAENFKFYHIKIAGHAFLHNQVRRMVGSSLSVCNGRMTVQEVKKMLDLPNTGWNVKGRPAPANGLHLLNVEYTKESLANSTEDVLKLPVNPLQSTALEYS